MGGDIVKIGRNFRYNYVNKNLKHVTNLGSYARKINIVANGTVKNKTLV